MDISRACAAVAAVSVLAASGAAAAATFTVTLEDVLLGTQIGGYTVSEGPTGGHVLSTSCEPNSCTLFFRGSPPVPDRNDPTSPERPMLPPLPPNVVYNVVSFDVMFLGSDFGAGTPRILSRGAALEDVETNVWYTLLTREPFELEYFLRGKTFLFDNFVLGPVDYSAFVPEPDIWALVILGSLATGAALRRQRRYTAAQRSRAH